MVSRGKLAFIGSTAFAAAVVYWVHASEEEVRQVGGWLEPGGGGRWAIPCPRWPHAMFSALATSEFVLH